MGFSSRIGPVLVFPAQFCEDCLCADSGFGVAMACFFCATTSYVLCIGYQVMLCLFCLPQVGFRESGGLVSRARGGCWTPWGVGLIVGFCG